MTPKQWILLALFAIPVFVLFFGPLLVKEWRDEFIAAAKRPPTPEERANWVAYIKLQAIVTAIWLVCLVLIALIVAALQD